LVPKGSVLIVESLDRLSRDGATSAFTQFAGILEKGVTIVTLMDGQTYTEESVNTNPGQLFTSLGIMLRANEESETKSKRIRAAWEKKRSSINERKMTKMVPSWLELTEDRSEFRVRKNAKKSVCKIYQMCINGFGVYSIAKFLNGRLDQFRPIAQADHWHASYVTKILKNRAVFGEFQPHKRVNGKRTPVGEPIKNYFPTVVSEEDFLRAQEALKQRRVSGAGRKGPGHPNLFSHLAVCGNCGGSMIYRNKGKPPKGGSYLRCQNSILNNGCTKPGWRYEQFEEAFFRFTKEINFDEIFNTGATEKRSELEGQRLKLSSELQDLRAKYDTIVDRLTDASLSEALLKSLDEKGTEIAQQVDDLQSKTKKIDGEITKMDLENTGQDQVDLLKSYANVTSEMTHAERTAVRFHMHSILVKSLASITVHNGCLVNPWEIPEQISPKLRAELKRKGVESDHDIERYFQTLVGSQEFEKTQRNFVVRFKNGVVKTVCPYEDQSLNVISKRMAKLISNSSDRAG
jgi:DNA invertase Pin-like site-specific DNA recombinase